MTVEELIELLETCNPQAEITLESSSAIIDVFQIGEDLVIIKTK